jgi:hypothetical protein
MKKNLNYKISFKKEPLPLKSSILYIDDENILLKYIENEFFKNKEIKNETSEILKDLLNEKKEEKKKLFEKKNSSKSLVNSKEQLEEIQLGRLVEFKDYRGIIKFIGLIDNK